MRTGQAAKALGVDLKTIHNWIKNPKLNKFFSAGARGEDGDFQRDISQEDLLVLNTIRVMSAKMRNSQKDWDSIARALDSGQVDRALPPAAMTVDTGITDMSRWEDSLATKAKLEQALERMVQLESVIEQRERRIAELEREKDELRVQASKERDALWERLVNDISNMKGQLSSVERELELWRSGRLKPE